MFRQVVLKGSFSGAAKTLQLSPSAVSRQIARLESQLDVVLFNRSTRSLSLTDAGHAVFGHSQGLAEKSEAILSVAQHMSLSPRGLLRVTAPVTLGRSLLSPLVVRFICLYPEVNIEVDLDDRIRDLSGESYDLAIRVTGKPHQDHIARRVGPLRYIFVSSPAFAEPALTNPERLNGKSLFLPSDMGLQKAVQLVAGDRQYNVDIGPRLLINNSDALIDAALSGGIALLPTFAAADALATGRLKRLLAEWVVLPKKESSVFVVSARRKLMSLPARVFVDFIMNEIDASSW